MIQRPISGDKNGNKADQPVTVEGQVELDQGLSSLNCKIARVFDDGRLHQAQRYAYFEQLGRKYGNQQVQRIVNKLQSAASTPLVSPKIPEPRTLKQNAGENILVDSSPDFIAGAAQRNSGVFIPPAKELVNTLGVGQPLEAETRTLMENRFGHSFSDVQVHTDGRADQLARQLNTRAFNVHNHIAFESGYYRPDSPVGQYILAHELAHVIQRRKGTVSKFSPNSVQRYEQEAERAATAINRGEKAEVQGEINSDEVATFPWLIAAAAILVGAALTLVPSRIAPDPGQAAERDLIDSAWIYVPVIGPAIQTIQGRSILEQGAGLSFLMLDAVAAGPMLRGAWVLLSGAGRAGMRALGRAGIRQLASHGVRGISEEAATREIGAALQSGYAVIGNEGWLNHSVIYVVEDGRVFRLEGSVSHLTYTSAGREISEETVRSMAGRLNEFALIESAEASMNLREAYSTLEALSWHRRMPIGCSGTQSLLLDMAGHSQLVPGGVGNRFLPFMLSETRLAQGTATSVHGFRSVFGVGLHGFAMPTASMFAPRGIYTIIDNSYVAPATGQPRD